MTTPKKKSKNAEPMPKSSEQLLSQKWSSEVIKAGYTVVPSVILRAQRRLHIDSTQLVVLLHLLDFWWQPSDMPWPSKRKIAERMGVHEKTIQRAMVELETEGLLKRKERYHAHGGRSSNRYDLAPLVARLKKIAKEISAAEENATEVKSEALKPSFKTKHKK